jgi:hypothetical protein
MMPHATEPTPLDYAWAQLAIELLAGGADADQLSALRECFYAGAHALLWVSEKHRTSMPDVLAGLARHMAEVEERLNAATH